MKYVLALLALSAVATVGCASASSEEQRTDSLHVSGHRQDNRSDDASNATLSPSFAETGGGGGGGAACSQAELQQATTHCHEHHGAMTEITSCVVRNGWIVYTYDACFPNADGLC